MRMAMRAQNQCRMTLETLATIKNPPVVYAKQANINNGGQQQVNNGVEPTGGNEASCVSPQVLSMDRSPRPANAESSVSPSPRERRGERQL
jgi:hypothetical protein